MPNNRTLLNPPSPPEWQNDLNPEYGAGQNSGLVGPHPAQEGTAATAYDIKDLNRHLAGYSHADLKQIVVLPPGTPLQQGATYLDLR